MNEELKQAMEDQWNAPRVAHAVYLSRWHWRYDSETKSHVLEDEKGRLPGNRRKS